MTQIKLSICIRNISISKGMMSITSCEWWSDDTSSGLEEPSISDFCQTFLNCQAVSDLPPFACMAHVGQVEMPLSTYATSVFQAGKPRLEIRRYYIRAWTSILGAEIEVVTMPFGVNVNNIVPLRILGWGFNVFRLQDSVYQFCRLSLQFGLDSIGHFWLWWAVNPDFLSHRILKVICCLQTKRHSHPIIDNSLIFCQLISGLPMEARISSYQIHARHQQKYHRNSRQSHLRI